MESSMYTSDTKADAKKAQAKATQAAEAARDTVIDLQEDLRSTANRLGRRVRDAYDHAGEELGQAREQVTTRIKQKPVESSLIALGVGFILGALFRR
jgi:ElaB/YqjD/DUF883 family membrane-anchored ribosome-binding protein